MENPVKTNPAKVIVKNVELAYVHLLQPFRGAEGNQSPKYSCVIIIPKTDTEQIRAIKLAIKAAHQIGQADKWHGKGPALTSDPNGCKHPLRDGDIQRPDDEAFKGCMFMTANASTKPGVVDEFGRDLTEPGREEEVYSGMKAHVSITFFAYEASGNRGIACGLNNVMKTADGIRRGGRVSAEADFAGLIKQPEAGGQADDWGTV